MKATCRAYSNLALTKYWGKKDAKLNLPLNGSISVTLDNLFTTTTVEFSEKLKKDIVIINGKEEEKKTKRAVKHIERIRKNKNLKVKIVSENNFPTQAGFSSSASGFAALTLASLQALNISLNEKEQSILSRMGSGSSCRSIFGGFVEWKYGETSNQSFAQKIFDPSHWDICIMAVVLDDQEKKIPTSKAHEYVNLASLQDRIKDMKKKNKTLKKYIAEKDFFSFGTLVEEEALEFQSLVLAANPKLSYWGKSSIQLMDAIRKIRTEEAIPVFFTCNTGPNLYLLCEKKERFNLLERIKQFSYIKNIIINSPGGTPEFLEKHLF